MSEFIEYIDNTCEQLRREEEALRTGDRGDEANLARIKLNICDIARTIHDVFAKTKGEDMQEAYLQKLAEMRLKWEQARDTAQEHGDTMTAVIEGIKAETMSEIEKEFLRLSKA